MRFVHVGDRATVLALTEGCGGFLTIPLTADAVKAALDAKRFGICVRYVDTVAMCIFYPSERYADDLPFVTGDEDIYGGCVVTGYDAEVDSPRGLTEFEETLLRGSVALRTLGGRTVLTLPSVSRRPHGRCLYDGE